MTTLWGRTCRRLLGLQPGETTCERRGFRGATEAMRTRLEQVGAAFLNGYHVALEHGTPTAVTSELESMPIELRGFGFEGAAMGLALLDALTPWSSHRIQHFLSGAGNAHAYMIHVGVGWVWARIPWGWRRAKGRLDPVLGWLALEGWGFHEGFFHWPKYISGQPAPKRFTGYESRVFDQGLGRSFWFVNGGNPELIAQSIASFSLERRADLWSGVGLSASYAGIVDEPVLRALRNYAGEYLPQLAQGSAFAAKARQRAGNLIDYTNLAATTFCDMSALDAALLCDTTLENLPTTASDPAFEIWRQRIQKHFQHKHHHHQPQLQEI